MPNDEDSVRIPPAFSLANCKILIAEDESVLAWELEDVLREFGGAHILSTATLKGALKLLASHQDVSLVLLDLKLQDGRGEILIGELLERRIPFIVVTGYSSRDISGFPVLTKPYSVKALIDAISQALKPGPS